MALQSTDENVTRIVALRGIRAAVPAGLVLVSLLAGCGGAGDSAGTGDTATTEAAATTVPLTYAEALTQRLADELRDPEVAAAVVDGIDTETLAAYEATVPLADVASSEALRYVPEETPDDEIESLVVFSFGNRASATDAIVGGPVNEALAAEVEAFVADHPVPVYAQWEVAEALEANGVPDVVSIRPVTGEDGSVEYLSTAGVAESAVQRAADADVDLGVVGVVCFADHVVRCVETAAAAGMDAAVPAGVARPQDYDPDSAQPWTRDRVAYLSTDLASRMAALPG